MLDEEQFHGCRRPAARLNSLLSLIDGFDREITTTTREIEEHAKADDCVDVLTQIRGVGRYLPSELRTVESGRPTSTDASSAG